MFFSSHRIEPSPNASAQIRLGYGQKGKPKTFQDAVTVTKLLDIRYLWIDSLCILQDDRDDWDREKGRTGAIYHQATVTIAAGHARNSIEGLFLSDPWLAYLPLGKADVIGSEIQPPAINNNVTVSSNENQPLYVCVIVPEVTRAVRLPFFVGQTLIDSPYLAPSPIKRFDQRGPIDDLPLFK